MFESKLFKLSRKGEITKEGHIMFKEDIVKELNGWRTEARFFRNRNVQLLKEMGKAEEVCKKEIKKNYIRREVPELPYWKDNRTQSDIFEEGRKLGKFEAEEEVKKKVEELKRRYYGLLGEDTSWVIDQIDQIFSDNQRQDNRIREDVRNEVALQQSDSFEPKACRRCDSARNDKSKVAPKITDKYGQYMESDNLGRNEAERSRKNRSVETLKAENYPDNTQKDKIGCGKKLRSGDDIFNCGECGIYCKACEEHNSEEKALKGETA